MGSQFSKLTIAFEARAQCCVFGLKSLDTRAQLARCLH
jgi:hypothetical protein